MGTTASPRKELPVYDEYLRYSDVYSGLSESSVIERRPALPIEVWGDYNAIPATPPPQTPYPGTPDGGGKVSGISGVALTQVPGNPFQFRSLAVQFLDMVPGNLFAGAYQPTLTDALGRDVPYNPTVWVADGVRRLVEFKYFIPPGAAPPFTLAYWRYTGSFATVNGLLALANEGGGGGQVYDSVVGSTANLRTLAPDPAAGNEGVIVSTAGTRVLVGNTMTGLNRPAAGARVFAVKNVSAQLEFRQLLAGTGVNITENANDITINTSMAPALNAFSNEGGGAGQSFDTIIGTTAFFRTINPDPAAGSEGIAVSTAGQLILIGNTLTGANLGLGAQLFAAKSAGAALQFRSLVAAAGSGLTLTQNVGDVTISATVGTVVSVANEGAGTGHIFDAVAGTTANLRTLRVDPTAANAGVAIADNGTVIDIGNTLTGTNLGAGSQLFSAKSGTALQFRSLIAAASSGLTLTQNVNDVTVDATVGTVVSIANEGAGTGHIFDAVAGTTANLRTLRVDPTAANAGIAIADNGTVVDIGNTLTGANLGLGAQVFSAKSGAALQFRSQTAGSSIVVTQNVGDIAVSLASAITVDLIGTRTVGGDLTITTTGAGTINLNGPVAVQSGKTLTVDTISTTTAATNLSLNPTGASIDANNKTLINVAGVTGGVNLISGGPISTANAVPATLITLATTSDTNYTLNVEVTAVTPTGGVATDGASFSDMVKVINKAGVLTAVAMQNLKAIDAGLAAIGGVSYAPSGANLLIQVAGIAATAIRWSGTVWYAGVST